MKISSLLPALTIDQFSEETQGLLAFARQKYRQMICSSVRF